MEKEWASFCTEISDYRQLLDDTVSRWVDYESSSKGLLNVLTELDNIVEEDVQDKIDHVTIRHSITRYQVPLLFAFIGFV